MTKLKDSILAELQKRPMSMDELSKELEAKLTAIRHGIMSLEHEKLVKRAERVLNNETKRMICLYKAVNQNYAPSKLLSTQQTWCSPLEWRA